MIRRYEVPLRYRRGLAWVIERNRPLTEPRLQRSGTQDLLAYRRITGERAGWHALLAWISSAILDLDRKPSFDSEGGPMVIAKRLLSGFALTAFALVAQSPRPGGNSLPPPAKVVTLNVIARD